MKNKIHIMTDIETLGTKDGATIFQIAAASFDIQTGEIKETINLKLDIESVKDLQVDGSTLKWWLNTNKELLTDLINAGSLTEQEMIKQFNEWISNQAAYAEHSGEVTLWGNGIAFDNVKIKSKMESLGYSYPIRYTNDRDVRTILALASDKTGLHPNMIKSSVQEETDLKHDAISDVLYQIRLICHCYDLLMDRKTSQYKVETIWRLQEEDFLCVMEDHFDLTDDEKNHVLDMAYDNFNIDDWYEAVRIFIELSLPDIPSKNKEEN